VVIALQEHAFRSHLEEYGGADRMESLEKGLKIQGRVKKI
jgi:hypothetical protein